MLKRLTATSVILLAFLTVAPMMASAKTMQPMCFDAYGNRTPYNQLSALADRTDAFPLTLTRWAHSPSFDKILNARPDLDPTFWKWMWWSAKPSPDLQAVVHEIRALNSEHPAQAKHLVDQLQARAEHPALSSTQREFMRSIVRVLRLETHDPAAWRDLIHDVASLRTKDVDVQASLSIEYYEMGGPFQLGLAEACRTLPPELANHLRPLFKDAYKTAKHSRGSIAIRWLQEFARVAFKPDRVLLTALEAKGSVTPIYKQWLAQENELFGVETGPNGRDPSPETVIELLQTLQRTFISERAPGPAELRVLGSQVNGRATRTSDLDVDANTDLVSHRLIMALEENAVSVLRRRNPFLSIDSRSGELLEFIDEGAADTTFFKSASAVQSLVKKNGIWLFVSEFLGVAETDSGLEPLYRDSEFFPLK